jgi:excisionase family DNA binding protein
MTVAAKSGSQWDEDLANKLTGAVSNNALLTVEDVAEMLQVPPSWVYEHTRQRSTDRIPAFRLGLYWRFRVSDVLAWIERQRVGTRPNA